MAGTPVRHKVLDANITPPFPAGLEQAVFGMGCFWGAERLFWRMAGVHSTAVGYAAGTTTNPTYEQVCSGKTGHAEVVLVVFNPAQVSYENLLKVFWEEHDPTQGNRQGNDIGTQYRSIILTFNDEQRRVAEESRAQYQAALAGAGVGHITTQIEDAGEFFYAEGYHQQYLHTNPNGYCGLAGTGVACGPG